MPSRLAEQFAPLFKDVFWLGMKWHEYNVLFGTSKDTVDTLNRTAGYFFSIVQAAMWDDILLHISRLSGPEKSIGKDNLTIRRLPPLIEDTALRTDIQRRVDACVDQSAYTAEHRNKRLAHHDLAMAVRDGEKDLTGVSRRQVRDSIESLQEIIRVIYAHFADTYFDFDTSLRSHNADALIYALQRAEAQQEAN